MTLSRRTLQGHFTQSIRYHDITNSSEKEMFLVFVGRCWATMQPVRLTADCSMPVERRQRLMWCDNELQLVLSSDCASSIVFWFLGQYATSCTGYWLTNGLSINFAWRSINANIAGLHDTCRHSVPISSVTTRRHMRAATQGDLNFPCTRTVTFGSCASAISGPTCRNSLPPSLKSSSMQPEQLRRQLKTTLMAQPS